MYRHRDHLYSRRSKYCHYHPKEVVQKSLCLKLKLQRKWWQKFQISNDKCVVKIRSEYSRLSISCVCRKCNRKSNFKIKFGNRIKYFETMQTDVKGSIIYHFLDFERFGNMIRRTFCFWKHLLFFCRRSIKIYIYIIHVCLSCSCVFINKFHLQNSILLKNYP